MGRDWVLWVLVSASGIHVVEEHALGWQGWAAKVVTPRLHMDGLLGHERGLIVLGISCAAVGWRAPAFALALPALVGTAVGSVLIGAVTMASALVIPRLGKSYRYPDA